MTAIDDFFTHYYARRPVNATFTGVHAYDDRLPDWSPDGLAAMDDEMRSLGAELAREYPAPASVTAFRTNPDLLDAELARGLLEIQRAENASLHGPRGNPALWTGEAVFSIIALMIRNFAPLEARADVAARRAADAAGFLSPRVGTPLPRRWIDRAERDCEGAAVLLAEGFRRWTAALDPATPRTPELLNAAARASRDLREFAEWLHSQPEAPESAMSCGPELFDLLLCRGHFCLRSRADLLAEARERFDVAHAQLDLMARSVAGSWQDAQVQLSADHPLPDEYFAAFEKTWHACRECAEAANVVSWPDWPIRYVPFPEWTADAAPYLYYLYYRSPAPFDPYTTYDYVVPPLPADPAEVDKHLRVWNHSTIKLNHVVHHGAIGHHVQNWFAYNQQRSRIGKVAAIDCANRIGMFCGGTMAEGWACYATDVMEELGFLTPLERVSQQHTRVRMLARAIVDIEFHQGTMSFSEAVAFYVERVGMSADAARAEAVKNSMFPCTAIMYWLGTQGIHDLRAEMKRREGPRFSLRRFHGELLGYGSIPVPLVSRMLTEAPLPG
ncbi:MAG TPA: DUF885 family protein [Gemmatimonadaceae bacterium]|nr:DUF885 family protein [Gemmatimonadaceae bacterium]